MGETIIWGCKCGHTKEIEEAIIIMYAQNAISSRWKDQMLVGGINLLFINLDWL
jgi:hypothetical protein